MLDLERCIKIAISSHPGLESSRAAIAAQEASVGITAAAARTQVSLSPSYSYSRTESKGQGGSYNTDISLKQEISTSGRRELSIGQATMELEARHLDETATVESVLTGVAESYYAVCRAARNLEIKRERVVNYEKRLSWAEEFYRVGTKPKIEVTKAQTDLANARLDLVSAQGALAKASTALAYAMGVPETDASNVVDVLAFSPWRVDVEQAESTAMARRPEISAQDIRVQGAEVSLAISRKGLSPSISGSAGYSFTGETDPFDDRGWRVSVGIDIPIVDGGTTREEVKKATADLASAQAKRESLRQDVVQSVRTAYASLVEAEEAVGAAMVVEQQARETLDLALGRYRAGVGQALEVSDAVETFASAAGSVVTSLYSHKASALELKRTMGVVRDEFDW